METSEKAQKESKKSFKRRNVKTKTLALVALLLGIIRSPIKKDLKALKKISLRTRVIIVTKKDNM